jgi:hypothetical protein
MMYFPDLRARRFTIRLRELTIGQSLELSARSTHLEQSNTTAFLRAAVVNPDIDPALWRVGERVLAVAHYLACVTNDADFTVGSGRYSDYLVSEVDTIPDSVALGDVIGEAWNMRHLTGRLAEAIERIVISGFKGRGLWLMGMMAAQMYRNGELTPDDMTEGALDEWLTARVQSIIDLPESEFEAMLIAFYAGRSLITHLFIIDADDNGLLCRAHTEDAGLPPARFSVRSNLSAWARAMATHTD